VDAGDDADNVDWSCYRYVDVVVDVDVKVTDRDVAVVEIVVDDVVLVVVGVAAFNGGAKNARFLLLASFWTGL
jgi:hypothetical protein